MATTPLTKHQIMLAAGGLRFDRDLRAGWSFEPSIGLVAKDVDRLGLAITSFKEPLQRAIRDVMGPSFRKNFDASGRPEKWPPLAEYTLYIKGLQGTAFGDKPLIRTGALMRGVQQESIWDVGNTSATIRKLPDYIWYGIIHQAGYGGMGVFAKKARALLTAKRGPRGFKESDVTKLMFALFDQARPGGSSFSGKPSGAAQIPQRQFVLFQEDDIDDIQEIFYEWLVEKSIEVGRFAR